MTSPRCPDDLRLEGYCYGELSFLESLVIRAHLVFCRDCRVRLSLMKEFGSALQRIPMEEPPEGFLDDLLMTVRGWDFEPDPPPIPVEHGMMGQKLRWGISSAILGVFAALQFKYGSLSLGFPGTLGILSSIHDVGTIWEGLWTGASWSNLKAVVGAVRADGLASLGILRSALPSDFLGVVIFGCTALAALLCRRKSSNSRGDVTE